MTKNKAREIAKKLANAVEQGFISEERARKAFVVIVVKYKRNEELKKLQDTDFKTWMMVSELMAI